VLGFLSGECSLERPCGACKRRVKEFRGRDVLEVPE
jgi:hypothetical protein